MTDSQQQFCLRWNNFQANITSQFEALRDDEDFVDVTFACDGRRLQAHKVVLSACSPYFKELFKVRKPSVYLSALVFNSPPSFFILSDFSDISFVFSLFLSHIVDTISLSQTHIILHVSLLIRHHTSIPSTMLIHLFFDTQLFASTSSLHFIPMVGQNYYAT